MNNATLFLGRIVPVVYELTDAELKQPDPKPRTEEVRVRQLKTPDYEFGFTVIADEFALTAFCVAPRSDAPSLTSTGRDKPWIHTVTPESYEQLRAVAQEVNTCFFAFAARREKFLREQQEQQIAAMASMPPEVMKMAHDLGARSLSPNTLPGPRPRPA